MRPFKSPLPKQTGPSFLVLRGKKIPIGEKTLVMGVLNVTPDSFSDGGKYLAPEAAQRRLEELVNQGADFVDVGAESTRPEASPVSSQEEIDRLLPVLKAWKKEWNAILSVDTYKSEVAKVALEHGASLVNDVTALSGDSLLGEVVAASGAGVVLMHMKGTPQTMQKKPDYRDVISEILAFFEERLGKAVRLGIKEESILLDPGIGFGKTVSHNLEILRRLRELTVLGRPLLIGPSRKSFIGNILNLPVEERLFGTAGAISAAILNGADMVRVHDVVEMKQVARVVDAVGR